MSLDNFIRIDFQIYIRGFNPDHFPYLSALKPYKKSQVEPEKK
jgi:hypothetical protein